MVFGNSKSPRFQDDLETANSQSIGGSFSKLMKMISGIQFYEPSSKVEKDNTIAESFQEKQLTRVFSEDYASVQRMILDPRGPGINRWNKCLFVACLISLFVNPLFFYLPIGKNDACIDISMPLRTALTIVCSVVDVFYMIQILVKFRTAYVAPSSRLIGRGELVIDPSKIASRYIKNSFWIDILAALPVPQLLFWVVIPRLGGANLIDFKLLLRSSINIQFMLRLYLIFPLSSQIIKTTGVVMRTAWAGAAFNLMLFMLASHVIGATFYFLGIERQEECWVEVCRLEDQNCKPWYFECSRVDNPARAAWFISSNITSLCDPNNDFFQFGIYSNALSLSVTQEEFLNKYFYCLWWGLQNLSSLGQNLTTSTYVGELIFVTIIALIGLVLFALYIGNMQTYLTSINRRQEEWRLRRNDTEQWMRHRQLPHELRESVRRYDRYRWVTTRGVDEEAILKDLPSDLHRDIKRHLCLDLVRRVPLFDKMDEHMLDAICERLKPVLCTPGTRLVREGDPVTEMFFIVRGHLDSYTTDGGRTGFFNSCRIGPGDFCGEELLTWALDPRLSINLPSSTRTVRAISEVEAFALGSEAVKFVASKFRRLHSKQMQHTFRCHSHQWRTWAACFIQAAWFRYKRRKQAAELKAKERLTKSPLAEPPTEQKGTPLPSPRSTLATPLPSPRSRLATPLPSPGSKLAIHIAQFVANSQQCGSEFDLPSPLQKPKEPDFFI